MIPTVTCLFLLHRTGLLLFLCYWLLEKDGMDELARLMTVVHILFLYLEQNRADICLNFARMCARATEQLQKKTHS